MVLPIAISLTGCKNKPIDSGAQKHRFITERFVKETISELQKAYPGADTLLVSKGVEQVSALWLKSDGNEQDFKKFCLDNFAADAKERETLFLKLSASLEILYGHFNKISLELKQPLHLDVGEIHPIDEFMGSFDASAHLTEDLFTNKVAFISMLNFPFYTLDEKNASAASWSRLQWAYARLGDVFGSRIPAEIQQKASETLTAADTYISEYNIYMGMLQNDKGQKLFPAEMKLISHWGLRDELKSNYAIENGLEKQKMIYAVMKRIIDQSIPNEVVNSNKYTWNPLLNKMYDNTKEVRFTSEPNTRYEVLLKNFLVLKEMDAYTHNYPNQILRSFDGGMEFTQEEIEKLFTDFISSPVIREVGKLVKKRLGRDLQPFDIWYDGFKSRSSISEDVLTSKTRQKYPTVAALKNDLPNLLISLGWEKGKADFIASRVSVDPSRGAGHAWGAAMRSDVAHLRTRVGKEGMDYKGYNIAMHEFGHNVEQTITLQDVDYYTLNGVPNTAFTEALAFVFQKRDLDMLGMHVNDPVRKHLMALDILWGSYEIMGVALLDMKVWKWMYANPTASAEELKKSVMSLSKEIWNAYYADIFGSRDEPILAIYSHMIDNPLYLANYPLGHLIEFQLEKHFEGKSFPVEVQRIYSQGKLTPQTWMKGATGIPVSGEASLKAAKEALSLIQ